MLHLATYLGGYPFFSVQLNILLLCTSLNSLKERQQQRRLSNVPNKCETRWALNVTWNKEEQSAAGMNAWTELAESFCRVAVFTWSCTDLPDYHLTSGLHAANQAHCSDKAWNATRRLAKDHSNDKMAKMIAVKLSVFVLANYLTREHVWWRAGHGFLSWKISVLPFGCIFDSNNNNNIKTESGRSHFLNNLIAKKGLLKIFLQGCIIIFF